MRTTIIHIYVVLRWRHGHRGVHCELRGGYKYPVMRSPPRRRPSPTVTFLAKQHLYIAHGATITDIMNSGRDMENEMVVGKRARLFNAGDRGIPKRLCRRRSAWCD